MKLALFAVVGLLSGIAYAASLRWNARLYLSARGPSWPVLHHVTRTSAVIAAFVGVARVGAGAFLAAVAGFACAHAAAVFAMQRRT